MTKKTLNNTTENTTSSNVADVQFYGKKDAWKLVCKASSEVEGWMKSTKKMKVENGFLYQVTTQQGDNVAEALCFVPCCDKS